MLSGDIPKQYQNCLIRGPQAMRILSSNSLTIILPCIVVSMLESRRYVFKAYHSMQRLSAQVGANVRGIAARCMDDTTAA